MEHCNSFNDTASNHTVFFSGMFTVILTIFALTVERFKAIRDPFFALQGSTKCKSVRIVTSLWVALTIYSVAAMFFVLDPDSQGMDEFIFGQHCKLISSKG